jgi:hypothetical protein
MFELHHYSGSGNSLSLKLHWLSACRQEHPTFCNSLPLHTSFPLTLKFTRYGFGGGAVRSLMKRITSYWYWGGKG